jgi:hypothetical protein
MIVSSIRRNETCYGMTKQNHSIVLEVIPNFFFLLGDILKLLLESCQSQFSEYIWLNNNNKYVYVLLFIRGVTDQLIIP